MGDGNSWIHISSVTAVSGPWYCTQLLDCLFLILLKKVEWVMKCISWVEIMIRSGVPKVFFLQSHFKMHGMVLSQTQRGSCSPHRSGAGISLDFLVTSSLVENSHNFPSQQLLCLDVSHLLTGPSKLKVRGIRRQYCIAYFFGAETIIFLYWTPGVLTAKVSGNQMWCKPRNDTKRNQGIKGGKALRQIIWLCSTENS